MAWVYLDNNATTRPLPAVIDAVNDALGEGFANPSSLHGAGAYARRLVDEGRQRVAALLHCRETEVVFTSCATESINGALWGALRATPKGQRPRLIISAVEHEALFDIAQALERDLGAEVVKIPVDAAGHLDLAVLDRELQTPTTLVSVMLANNETAVLFPAEEVADLVRRRGSTLHLDAVQAVGKTTLDVGALGVDYLSLSGHKFHAPKGVGVLYLKRGARFVPLLPGATQEGARRAGTENVPGIAGLGVAAEHMSRGIEERRLHLRALSDRLEKRLLQIEDSRLNGDPSGRLPGTTNIAFKGIEGAAIVLTVAREGVCISAGSACSAAEYGGSHVLEAMKTPFDYLYGAIRISCCETNTSAEIDRCAEAVEKAVAYLRAMNPNERASTQS